MISEARASYTDSFGHAFDAKGRITVPSDWRGESFEKRLFVLPSTRPLRAGLSRLVAGARAGGVAEAQGRPIRMRDARGGAGEHCAERHVRPAGAHHGEGEIAPGRGAEKGRRCWSGGSDHFQIWDKAAWEARQPAPDHGGGGAAARWAYESPDTIFGGSARRMPARVRKMTRM